jgi:hypothetical protein
MSEELVKYVSNFVQEVICGFESGIYKMIQQNNNDRLKLLSDNHQPFIPIFRDLHETYYTSTFNSIVGRDNKYVVETFDKLQQLSLHSHQCMLNILANLIVSVHFNLDRKNLNYRSYDLYMKSLKKEIGNIISVVNLAKLFDHKCGGPANSDLKAIPNGEKFITISMTFKSNGVEKEIKSFNDPNDLDDNMK